jgi:hypothetical protein
MRTCHLPGLLTSTRFFASLLEPPQVFAQNAPQRTGTSVGAEIAMPAGRPATGGACVYVTRTTSGLANTAATHQIGSSASECECEYKPNHA